MAQVQQLSVEVAELRQARTFAQVAQPPAVAAPAITAGFVPPAPIVHTPLSGNAPKSKVPKESTAPKMGESGSGYTRLANGKFVKNRRPKARPIQDRQAKNWRARSTTALVQFLKERRIGKEDPKPTDDSVYQALVSDLEMSKLYMEYLKNEDEPLEVQEWRNSLIDDQRPSGNSPAPGKPAGPPAPPAPKQTDNLSIPPTKTGPLDKSSSWESPKPVFNLKPQPIVPRDDRLIKYKVYYDLVTGQAVNEDSRSQKTWAEGYDLPNWIDPVVLSDDKAFRALVVQYHTPPKISWAEDVEASDQKSDGQKSTSKAGSSRKAGRMPSGDFLQSTSGVINQRQPSPNRT
jgi:hypothetical protein